jgi:chromosome segregation ATPase
VFDLYAVHIHKDEQAWANAPSHAIELRHILGLILTNQEKQMAAIDDLKAAIADLTTELADNNAEIEALLSKITAPGTSDADVAAAVQSIRDLIASNKAEVDKAKAATA